MHEALTLITYFIIYSFIGWILESTYKSILQKRLVNSGFLHGPLCPIYGYGALIMYLSLRHLTQNILILFFFGLIVLSIFEYAVGWFLEVIFKTKYWDYSKKMFNIHGRVCMQNSLYWGVLGVVFMKGIHPLAQKLINMIPYNYALIAVSGIIILMMADTIVTVIGLIKINVKLKNWEEISTTIKNKIDTINARNLIKLEKIKDLKLKRFNRPIDEKNNVNILAELRRRQAHYQALLDRRLRRLRRAFPSMNSERLSKFLNNSKKS